MTSYWIGITMLDHLEIGFKKRTFGIGHGKRAPLEKMKPGDRIVFYLPKKVPGISTAENKYQRFRGFAVVDEGDVFQESVDGRCMFRKKLTFTDTEKEASILPLIDRLSFIKNKTHWGFPFLKGYVRITKEDWDMIEQAAK